MDESLAVVRGLLTGEPVTSHGKFFDLDAVLIAPAPSPPVPLVVGGRSDAAIQRAAWLGDGWLGIWASACRRTLPSSSLPTRTRGVRTSI
jgi:alkanesulfonate monooxygenase SsuD/methylene tetrahydromethanopterin reductase-like flavin-dependent oxidoreductase (luciferase family)